MKTTFTFVPYDDEDMDHVMYGPDYGQTSMPTQSAWRELDSDEYSDLVNEMKSKILGNNIKFNK